MASSMDMVCNTLGIDRVNMDNKMMLIEEHHGTDANFLVNAVLWSTLKKERAICLVLCHNTFGHYHNVGMRLGYNLLDLKEKGQVTVVEPMKIVADNVTDMSKITANREKLIITDISSKEHIALAHRFFVYVKEMFDKAANFNESVVLIIDDINHLLDLGFAVYDIMYFVRYLRSFMASHLTSQLCILAHMYQEDPQISNADMVANGLKYMAHLCVTTEPFKTGYSGDASGKLNVYWRANHIRSKYHWAEKMIYLFKLLDWHVKVYAPGEASVLS